MPLARPPVAPPRAAPSPYSAPRGPPRCRASISVLRMPRRLFVSSLQAPYVSSVPAGAGPCAQTNTPPERQESSGSSVVGRSARRQRPFGLGRLFLSFFFSWSSRQPTRSVHECVDAACARPARCRRRRRRHSFSRRRGRSATRCGSAAARSRGTPGCGPAGAGGRGARGRGLAPCRELVGCGAAAASLGLQVQRTDVAAVVVH